MDHIAAVEALTGPQDALSNNRKTYRERRNAFCNALRDNGWNVPMTPATMFTWFPLPEPFAADDEKFCMDLLDKAGVLCVPGSAFGEGGEGWVRFALIHPPDVLREAACRIAKYLHK